tara:strand:+ start:2800 stop:3000 length:201 start_codon:yes stop_codon:yes gene_type:complete
MRDEDLGDEELPALEIKEFLGLSREDRVKALNEVISGLETKIEEMTKMREGMIKVRARQQAEWRRN